MYTNASLTIYNIYFDIATRTDKYQRTLINNVFFDEKKATNRLQSGLDSADHVLLLIPFQYSSQSKYVPPKAFDELTDVEGYFTLQNGDRIVKGDTGLDISGKISILDEHFEAYTITSVDTKDFGSKSMRHWEVGAR